MLLLELNRMLRPGGYFVWSATPVYRNNPEDNAIWRGLDFILYSKVKIIHFKFLTFNKS